METAPAEVYAWGVYDQNIPINHVKHYPYILLWCAKWLGKREVLSSALIDFPKTYKKNKRDDSMVARALWKLIDEADIVVTQNGDNFDIKRMNLAFLKAGLTTPSPYKSLDVCKTGRATFGFLSNKLDSKRKELGGEGKMDNGGFKTHIGCMEGSKKSWDIMRRYCKKDVLETERDYLAQKPFIKNHPNVALYELVPDGRCTSCGSKRIKRNGQRYDFTNKRKYQAIVCKDCGKYMRGKVA